jgi:hypothetical protein
MIFGLLIIVSVRNSVFSGDYSNQGFPPNWQVPQVYPAAILDGPSNHFPRLPYCTAGQAPLCNRREPEGSVRQRPFRLLLALFYCQGADHREGDRRFEARKACLKRESKVKSKERNRQRFVLKKMKKEP